MNILSVYRFLVNWAQNYEKNAFFCTKSGLYTLFFNKKVIFFHFLFVF